MKLTDKAQALTRELADLFMHPETMAEGLSTILLTDIHADRPMAKWSFRNKLLAWKAGTFEARTFNQWRKLGVKVNKGAHCFLILGPILVKPKDEDGDDEGGMKLVGFRCIPEFRVEDTDFADQVPDWSPASPPPLMEIAKTWGIDVRYVPANVASPAAGYTNCDQYITLCTHDDRVFFHELVHVADAKANGKRAVDNPRALEELEAIAEMGAAVIARMFGYRFDNRPYTYVSRFTDKPQDLVFKILPKLEKALKLVMSEAEKLVESGVLAPF